MSTRCYIGIENKDKTVSAIYCHHDGYPNGVGEMLKKHYWFEDSVKKLVALGGISSLAPQIGEKNDFYNPDYNFVLAYSRDRNEALEILSFDSKEQYINEKDLHIEWRYLFTDDQWTAVKGRR
jgi:hypothetical protein